MHIVFYSGMFECPLDPKDTALTSSVAMTTEVMTHPI